MKLFELLILASRPLICECFFTKVKFISNTKQMSSEINANTVF